MKKMMVRAALALAPQDCDFAVFDSICCVVSRVFPGDGHQHDGHLRWGNLLRSGAHRDLHAMVSACGWKPR